MSQHNEIKPQPNEAHTEFSLEFSSKEAHAEITIPVEQAKRAFRPIVLVGTHVITVGLTAVGVNPSILGRNTPPNASPTTTIVVPNPTCQQSPAASPSIEVHPHPNNPLR